MAQAMKWCQGRLCASTIDQVASAALYSVGPEYFAAVREEYRARRDALVEGLKKYPASYIPSPREPSMSWPPCPWTTRTSSNSGC